MSSNILVGTNYDTGARKKHGSATIRFVASQAGDRDRRDLLEPVTIVEVSLTNHSLGDDLGIPPWKELNRAPRRPWIFPNPLGLRSALGGLRSCRFRIIGRHWIKAAGWKRGCANGLSAALFMRLPVQRPKHRKNLSESGRDTQLS